MTSSRKIVRTKTLGKCIRKDFTNIRRDTCGTFKKKKRDCMKAEVDKLEENSNNKNTLEMYKDINEIKKGYRPLAYAIKNGKTVTDITGILSDEKSSNIILNYLLLCVCESTSSQVHVIFMLITLLIN